MEAHPKQQKTKRNPRLYMRNLVLITINIALNLINFISQTTEYLAAPFKNMTRDDPKKNYTPKDNRPRTKPKRRNSIKRFRHWKKDTHVSWEISQKLIKLLLTIATFLYIAENLHKELYKAHIDMKLHNLIHNKSLLPKPKGKRLSD